MVRAKKRAASPLRAAFSFFKLLYLLLFAVSAVVVTLYLVFRVAAQAPEVDAETQVTLYTDTEDDEQEAQVVTLTRKEQFHTFLLMGSDDGNGNADTIMVGAYDGLNGKVSVVSIPRDTLVDVSRTVKKINAAYGAGGVEQLLDELTPILGFRPDHYIKVDIQAFVDVVDALGGVSYYVPEDMYHDDGAGFIIDLKEGLQWLDGYHALQLVRYRGYANADLGRIQTQQKFLQQIAKQVLSVSSITKINEFAKILGQYFDTDLSVSELAWFGAAALDLDFSNDITFATLPGDGTVSYKGVTWYYQLYPEECLEIINSTVNPYTEDITLEMTHILQVS